MHRILILSGLFMVWATNAIVPPQAATAQERASISYDQALYLMEQGRGNEALAALKVYALQGNMEAHYKMGQIYRLGLGVPINLQQSMVHYRDGADRGHSQAALTLANILYFDLYNQPGSVEEAVDLWKAQAIKRQGQAYYMLGNIFWTGERGVLADPILAYGLMWEASRKRVRGAIEGETIMREKVILRDRMQGQKVVGNLATNGFPKTPLVSVNAPKAPEGQLYVDTGPAKGHSRRAPPQDWTNTWRILIGGRVSRKSANRLRSEIGVTLPGIVGDLVFHIMPAPNPRGDLDHLLVAGPFKDNYEGLVRCSYLKQYEYQCESLGPTRR